MRPPERITAIPEFTDIFMQMVVLFAVGATGYASKKFGLMDEDFDKKLSKLILSTAMPAMIVASVLTADALPSIEQIIWTIVVSCISYFVAIAIAFIITAVLRIPDGHRGVYRFMMVFGNAGFIGFPVITIVFGAQALIYATVFNLAFNILVFSLGVWLLASDNEYGVKIKMTPKAFLSPCIVACVVAIILAFANVHGVPVVGAALDTLGRLTTPAAMLIIGSSLANVSMRQLIGGPRLMVAALFRLLITPAIVWLPLHFLVSDPVLLGVIVLLSAMPVAANGTMLCYQYGGDSKTMSQGTFITAILSLVTIPLLAVLVVA